MKNLFIFAILLLIYSFGSSVIFAQEPPCAINYQACRIYCLPAETVSTNETSRTQTAAEELVNNIYFPDIYVGSPTCNGEYCSAYASEEFW